MKKRLMIVLLAAALILLLSVTAFAETESDGYLQGDVEDIFRHYGIFNWGYYSEEGGPSAFTVYYYSLWQGVFEDYITETSDDGYTHTFQMTYEEYMAAVSRIFVNPPDMKEYLADLGLYDQDTDLVTFTDGGGFGDICAWVPLSTYESGDYVYVQGLYLYDFVEDTDGLVENFDYYYDSLNQPLYIECAVEMTLLKCGNGYKIAAYEQNRYYIIDDVLYAYYIDEDGNLRTDWGVDPYSPVTIQYYLRSGDTCTLVEDNGATLLENDMSTFEHNDGLWYLKSLMFTFDVELADGYELEAVGYEDASGSGDVKQLSFGSYLICPSGALTLKIYTIDTSVDYYSKETGNGEITIYKYNEETGEYSDIYYPIMIHDAMGQSIVLEEGSYTTIGKYAYCYPVGAEIKWSSSVDEGYIPRVQLTEFIEDETVTSIVGASGSEYARPGLDLRAVPYCVFDLDSPNATVEVVQGLVDLGDGTFGSTEPTAVELKITANDGYEVTGVKALYQGADDYAVGTYDSGTGTWKFYLEFVPDTIVVSTAVLQEEPITIVGGTDDTEVTVQIPAEEAEKVEGLTLIVEELDEAVEEKAVSLIVKNLDTEEDYIYILDIYFENADGEKTEVNATMTVTVAVPEGWAAKNVGVYYVNPDTGEVVDMKAVASADGKTLTFTTDHFSYYALVQTTIPPTGDGSGVTLWVVLLAASCCGLAALPLLSKKRQRI